MKYLYPLLILLMMNSYSQPMDLCHYKGCFYSRCITYGLFGLSGMEIVEAIAWNLKDTTELFGNVFEKKRGVVEGMNIHSNCEQLLKRQLEITYERRIHKALISILLGYLVYVLTDSIGLCEE